MSVRLIAVLLSGGLLMAPLAFAVPSVIEPIPAANSCTIQTGTPNPCNFTCRSGKPLNVTITGLVNVAVRGECVGWTNTVVAQCTFVVTCSATSSQLPPASIGRCTASADVTIVSATCSTV